MATKFKAHNDAVNAAIAHNQRLCGGNGSGYIINRVPDAYDGFKLLPGWYEACAKYPGGEHRVSPI